RPEQERLERRLLAAVRRLVALGGDMQLLRDRGRSAPRQHPQWRHRPSTAAQRPRNMKKVSSAGMRDAHAPRRADGTAGTHGNPTPPESPPTISKHGENKMTDNGNGERRVTGTDLAERGLSAIDVTHYDKMPVDNHPAAGQISS